MKLVLNKMTLVEIELSANDFLDQPNLSGFFDGDPKLYTFFSDENMSLEKTDLYSGPQLSADDPTFLPQGMIEVVLSD